MVLCLLSRESHGDTGKLNHEETVRGPEIAIFPEKSEILLLILVIIQMGNGGCSVNSGARAPAPARHPRKQMSSPHAC